MDQLGRKEMMNNIFQLQNQSSAGGSSWRMVRVRPGDLLTLCCKE